MKKATIVAGMLAIVAGSASAQSQTKIYGFADAQFDVISVENGVVKQFNGADTFSLRATHANLYFDFKPNDKVSTLLEVGLLTRPSYGYKEGTKAVGGFTYGGNPISDAQAIDIMVAGGMPRDTAVKRVAVQKVGAPSADSIDRLGLSVERIQMDLNFSDPFKLRFGRFITPAGVWNVDHGSPVVLTVRQPIQTTMIPIFPGAQVGMMGFGNVPVGDHDLSYSGYISGGRIDGASSLLDPLYGSPIDQISDFAYGGHVGMKFDFLKSVAIGASYYNGPIKQKYQRTEVVVAIETGGKRIDDIDVVDVYTQKEREYALGGDAKIEVSNLLLQGEVNYRYRDNEMAEGSASTLGWYGLVGWNQPVVDALVLTPYAMYERLSTDTEDAGASGAFQDVGMESFYSVLFGVNATVFSNFHLKTEYTFVRYTLDDDVWAIKGVSDDDLNTGIWSTQVSVAF